MKALIISDKEFQSEQFRKIEAQTEDFLKNKGFEYEKIAVGKEDLTFCMGCFGCWIKKPGECVINDLMSQINRKSQNSDMVIYLCPVVFGQFSANIKNAVDRWIPNILPFFYTRKDGSTMHPKRYDTEPLQIFIGYGDGLSDEDGQLFYDVIKKHREEPEVLVIKDGTDISKALDKIDLRMAGISR